MLELEANLLARFISVYILYLDYIHQYFPFSSILAALKIKSISLFYVFKIHVDCFESNSLH